MFLKDNKIEHKFKQKNLRIVDKRIKNFEKVWLSHDVLELYNLWIINLAINMIIIDSQRSVADYNNKAER